MEKFEVSILGCGSAKATLRHWPSAQIVNVRDKLFMVDCGEGAQVQMMRMGCNFNRLGHIFISHLHGDHLFGLMGLLSTLGLMHRTAQLHLHAHAKLWELMKPWLSYFCAGEQYEIVFEPLPEANEPQLIYEDRSLTITSLPLKHRVTSCGFLFREKPALPHLRGDLASALGIPHHAISSIKEGAGWTTPDGDFYPHAALVRPADPPRAYAYCSDTAYLPQLAEWVKDVDVLYHEATFGLPRAARAAETLHSTAHDAATVARDANARRLIIGHFSSRYRDESELLDEARAVFPATELAREGLLIKV